MRGEHAWVHASPGYRSRLIAFNYRIAAQARLDQLRSLCPLKIDLESLRANPRAERFLSRWILSEWRLSSPYCFQLDAPQHRVALVAVGDLDALAERLGLISCADVIWLCIRRDERAQLVQKIGDARRQYAVSAAVRYGTAIKTLQPLIPSRPAGDLSLDDIARAGWRTLLCCVEDAPEAVKKRFLLKLPIGLNPDAAHADGGELWPLIKRVMKSDFREEWQACCC